MPYKQEVASSSLAAPTPLRREDRAGPYDADVAPPDTYISVDIEADGPIPGVYSMISIGMALAGRFDGQRFEAVDPSTETFYAELAPISEEFDPQALAVSGLDRDALRREGEDPAVAMSRAADWVDRVAAGTEPM